MKSRIIQVELPHDRSQRRTYLFRGDPTEMVQGRHIYAILVAHFGEGRLYVEFIRSGALFFVALLEFQYFEGIWEKLPNSCKMR